MSRSQLFVGRLPMDVREKDVEEVFEKYGSLVRCDVKYGKGMYGSSGRRGGSGRTGLAYAFVDYDDKRDAEDAIKYENGRELRGQSIVVEWARGPSYRSRDNSNFQRNSNYRSSEECYRCHRTGHWARDCPDGDRGGDRYYPRQRRSRSRSRSRSYRRRRSPSRSRSRSRNRSPSPYQRAEKSRSASRDKRAKQRSASRSVTPKSMSRTRSRSPDKARMKPEKTERMKAHTPSKSPKRSRSPQSRSVSRTPNRDSRSPEKYVNKVDRSGGRSISKEKVGNYDNDRRSLSRSQSR